MKWIINLATTAKKSLAKIPANDYDRIREVLAQMENDPFAGDLRWLRDMTPSYRRRVGRYRILFDAFQDSHVIKITDIWLRDDTTYRKKKL